MMHTDMWRGSYQAVSYKMAEERFIILSDQVAEMT